MKDLGLLLLRAPAGALLAAHGAQKLFGWFDGNGVEATGKGFEAVGYPQPRNMALLAGASEVAAGAGLAAGAFTPAAASAAVGVMTNAAVSVHGKNGPWAANGGYEYPLVLGTLAAGVALHGPGRFSVDAALGLLPTSIKWGLGAITLGLGAAAAALYARHQTLAAEPQPAEPQPTEA